MANVEQFPSSARVLTEFEALVASAPTALDAIPGAVYLCDSEGYLVRFNREAAELWGREPDLESGQERFCGSRQLFLVDGSHLPHSQCPMAEAIKSGVGTRNQEVVIERPDGTCITALVNIRPLRDHQGRIEGAINCFQDITARKQIEDEVRRSRQDLEDFFENSAIGLHIVGDDGVILRANKAELDLLGYTAEEYIGRHIAEFHADSDVIDEILRRLSCGQQLTQYPARLRAKDGSIKDVLITSNSRFEDGKFVSTRCFTTDVSELRASESARRESDERLSATYEAATVAIAEVDQKGRFVRVNDALCAMMGRSRDELYSSTFLEFTHEADRDEDAAQYERQVRGEINKYTIRKRSLKADGSIIYLDVFSSSVRDESGRFRYGVRVIQDVTARQVAQDKLRESERKVRELLEALPAAIYTTDADGRVTFYNKAAVDLAGRKPNIGIDEWCVSWRLYWPDGTPMPHDQCPMAITLREGRAVRGGEAIAERPDGTRVPFIPYPTPLRDGDGKLVGAVNMLVDITDLKQAETRQKVLIDELNHRVKNTLATVQSLAARTARHATTLEGFVETFDARILALARAHDLLTKRCWEGADLRVLVSEILAPHAGAGHQIASDGPPVELNARAAVSMAMAFNELATNAAKYGSLSVAAGSLSVSWTIEPVGFGGSALSVAWVEAGGPSVARPERKGFGTKLLQSCIERDLDGELDLVFDLTGLRCHITVPLDGAQQLSDG